MSRKPPVEEPPQDKELKSAGSYEVGYGKPPKRSRFKPGQSGNPRGRPRGSKNRKPALNEERLKVIVLEEAYRTIKVNDGPRQVTVPMAQAVVRSLAHSAVKGNTRAQRLFSEMVVAIEAENKKHRQGLFEEAVLYKEYWEAELERRRVLGIEAPDPIPHPDHVLIDPRNGTVEIRGPMTREEKSEWDWWSNHKKDCEEELPKLRTDLARETDPAIRRIIEDEIKRCERLLEVLKIVFPDEDPLKKWLAFKYGQGGKSDTR